MAHPMIEWALDTFTKAKFQPVADTVEKAFLATGPTAYERAARPDGRHRRRLPTCACSPLPSLVGKGASISNWGRGAPALVDKAMGNSPRGRSGAGITWVWQETVARRRKRAKARCKVAVLTGKNPQSAAAFLAEPVALFSSRCGNLAWLPAGWLLAISDSCLAIHLVEGLGQAPSMDCIVAANTSPPTGAEAGLSTAVSAVLVKVLYWAS